MKRIVVGILWGIMSSLMGFPVVTIKGLIVFSLGWAIILICVDDKKS